MTSDLLETYVVVLFYEPYPDDFPVEKWLRRIAVSSARSAGWTDVIEGGYRLDHLHDGTPANRTAWAYGRPPQKRNPRTE